MPPMSAGRPYSLWLRNDVREQLENIADQRETTVAALIHEAVTQTFGTPRPASTSRPAPPAG